VPRERSLRAERILETCLYAGDLEAAEDFDSRVLGLTVQAKVAGTRRVRAGPRGVHGSSRGTRGLAGLAAASRYCDRTGNGVAAGRPLRFFRDPAGNSLELTSPSIWRLGMPLFVEGDSGPR
jgi:hypothetical protein